MVKNIVKEIKKAGLVGRGGAEFPTHVKWEMVKRAKGRKKYVVCNGSEGEPDTYKDWYILKTEMGLVFEGMRVAMDYLGTKEGVINLNVNYYTKLESEVEAMVERYGEEGYRIKVYKEVPRYAGGEETGLLNNIEGRRLEPRMKPPYPSDEGLYGYPTLIHNVETLYEIARVARGDYDKKRYCTITGAVDKRGVYRVEREATVARVLKETGNVPEYDYFLQVGGGASGIVINKNQARRQKITGSGSIIVYRATTHPVDLLRKWFDFYDEESCGKCTPCREGTYQLQQLVENGKKIPWEKIEEILEVLEETSFCALGRGVPVPVRGYIKNVLKKKK